MILLTCTSFLGAAEVKNIKPFQEGSRMFFQYDLVGDEGEAEVNVTSTVKGKLYTADKLHLEGDFGRVKPGKAKKVYWDVLKDFPRGLSGDVKANIKAEGKGLKEPLTASAKVKTITYTARQPYTGNRPPDEERVAAQVRAEHEALEMAKAYVESLPAVKDSGLPKDEIRALIEGMKPEVVSQKRYATQNASGVEVMVKIDVDTAVVEERIKKLLAGRAQVKEIEEKQRKEKERIEEIARREAENRRLTATPQGLTAMDWFEKSQALWQDGRYTDPQKAVEYLNEFIRLKPDAANIYYNRGIAYQNLGQHQPAIQDFDQAIRLSPNFAEAYNNRGNAYQTLGQYQRAIQDFDQAIRLRPNFSEAYNSRGAAYLMSRNNSQGCEDLKKACSIGNCRKYESVKSQGSCP